MSKQHLFLQHLSILGISQLLLTQFWPNFKGRFQGQSLTDTNCYCDICQGNICPSNISPYQHISPFTNQIFFGPKFFWTRFFSDLNPLYPQFSWQKFWTQNFFDSYFWTYDFLDLKFFSSIKFKGGKLLNPNFFSQNFFY